MSSQFTKIYTGYHIDSIIDELSQKAENKLENTKSENVRLIVEMGYKACLEDFTKNIWDDTTTLFVDKSDIHETTMGHVPYEDPSITKVTCYKTKDYDDVLHESDEIPDEIYVLHTSGYVKFKKVDE
jgi:hypothetical protein